MNEKEPQISLIIAVYNKPEFLELVFLSCLNQSFNDFEIIVADDGSGSEIRDCIGRFVNKFRYPVVHCWHEDSGFRKTIIVNKAAARARADYLVFIDGDCILHHKFLNGHWKNRSIGVVLSGRRVRFDEELTQKVTKEDVLTQNVERVPFWINHCRFKDIKHGIYIPYSTVFEYPFRVRWRILGSNFSLFKADYLSINGYDERIIGRGMEDSNLHERAFLIGLQCKSVVREALQYHLYHTFDPIPHSEEVIREFCMPAESWTPFGIVK